MRLLLETILALYLLFGVGVLVVNCLAGLSRWSTTQTVSYRVWNVVGVVVFSLLVPFLWPLILLFQSHVEECEKCQEKYQTILRKRW